MRIAGNDHRLCAIREIHHRRDHCSERRIQLCAGILKPETHIRGDLVITATRGVQLGRGRHTQRQRLLDIHVHIFQRHIPIKLSRLDFDQDRVQPCMDRIALLSTDDANMR